MAKAVRTSGILSKLGDKARKAFNKHKKDDTRFDEGGNLPAGIEGGVAKLKEVKFDTYKSGDLKGKPFFGMTAVVVSPKNFNGMKLAGQQMRQNIPLCDTPKWNSEKTLDEHLARVTNELRKLGLETKEMDYDELETAAVALADEDVYMGFRTYTRTDQKGNPASPGVVWRGAVEYDPAEDEDEETEDDSGEADEDEEEEEEDEEESEAEEDEEEEESEEEDDPIAELRELAEKADSGDKGKATIAAQKKITAAAKAAELKAEDYDTWSECVDAIAEAAEGSEDEEEEESDEPKDPEVGDTVEYKPPKSKKRFDCEVVKVFKKTQKADLKNLDDGKTLYKGVAWDVIASKEEDE